MALPSSKPAGSDFPPIMIIIKGGHRRGGASGYIHVRSLRRRETRSSGRADQDGGGTRRAGSPPAAAPALRANSRAKLRPTPTFGPPIRFHHPCLRKRSASSLASGCGVESSRPVLGLARTMFAARARTPFAHDRCACPVGRGCGHSPRRRRTSCAIRVPMRPPRAAPLRALRPRAPRFTHPVCRAPRPLRGTKTLFNSST